MIVLVMVVCFSGHVFACGDERLCTEYPDSKACAQAEICDALTKTGSYREYLVQWHNFSLRAPEPAGDSGECLITIQRKPFGCTFAARYVFVSFLHDRDVELFPPVCHPKCSRDIERAVNYWPGFYRSETSYRGLEEQEEVLKAWTRDHHELFFVDEFGDVDVRMSPSR